MEVVKPSIELLEDIDWKKTLRLIERSGKVCYNAYENISEDSHTRFIKTIIKNKHESVLEHCKLTLKIICSRACSLQIVRHRLASYSQKSQRYCDESNLEIIVPEWVSSDSIGYQKIVSWGKTCQEEYKDRLFKGMKKENARGALSNETATEVIDTMNFRAIRHFLYERGALVAQDEIRYLAVELYKLINEQAPILVCDFELKEKEGREGYPMYLKQVTV